MRIIHKDITNPIVIDENKINILVLENKNFFINKINELINQINGDYGDYILFDLNNEELSISKNCDILTDLFCLDFDSKKIKSAIFNELKNISNSEVFYIKIRELEKNIRDLILEIMYESDFELELEENFDAAKFLKIYDISISKNYNTLIEKFITYIDVLTDVLKIKVIFCVNLLNLFDEIDRIETYKYLLLKKKKVVFIENYYESYNLEYEEKYIIDKDMCEIF
jgi:CRISPR-associated protein, csn2 family